MDTPLCRYCGKKIAKRPTTVWLETKERDFPSNFRFSRYLVVSELPRTKEDCQKLTNKTVISISRQVKYDYETDTRSKEFIRSFNEWDGESYIDNYFCNGGHAKRFAYAVASAGLGSKAYNEAKEKSYGS